MASSGSRNFDLDTAEIIEEAYERCGLEMRTAYDAKTARRSLNLMFADWANRGLNLWTVKQATLSLVAAQATYTLTADYADLLEVVVRKTNTDTELTRMSRGEYLSLPNKTQAGKPSQFFYNRQITPELTLWPVPDAADTLVYYYVQRIDDMDTLGNTADTPFRFLPCVVAGLAYYLALKYAPERVQMLKAIYEEEFQRASDEDEDRVPLRLQPSISYLRVN